MRLQLLTNIIKFLSCISLLLFAQNNNQKKKKKLKEKRENGLSYKMIEFIFQCCLLFNVRVFFSLEIKKKKKSIRKCKFFPYHTYFFSESISQFKLYIISYQKKNYILYT